LVMSGRMMELQRELLALRISDWGEKVFSFQWFFIVFLIIVPWIIWWRLVNKKHISEILSFGLMIAIVASILNEIGLQILLWSSPYSLAPVPGRWYAPAYSYLPVLFMLIYQYFRTWKSFTAAVIAAAAVSAFVLQPVLSWMGVFVMLKWNYIYSFLLFILAGLGVRMLHQAIIRANPAGDTLTGSVHRAEIAPAVQKRIMKQDFDKEK